MGNSVTCFELAEMELISLLKEGDQQVFSYFYRTYSPRIYVNLKRLVKDEELAQELLQEVFVKIWERRPELTIQTSFKSYLYRIAENLARDFFRKAQRDKKLTDYLLATATELYIDNERLYIDKQNRELLNKAIDILPAQRRRIFVLCKIEGKSYEEVGRLLGISCATINDHIVKATKAIKKYFLVTGELHMVLIAATMIVEQI